jgi:hypothetical protein
MKAVDNAPKKLNPTTKGIALELQKITQIYTEQLQINLREAEKVGLIKFILVNKEDRPVFAWRSLLPEYGKLKTCRSFVNSPIKVS